MSIAIITGSAGLVGSEAVRHFAALGLDVIGIDNDMRRVFFGKDASTQWMRDLLCREIPSYQHHNIDIRNAVEISQLFERAGSNVKLIVHAAAQPSHDWAARDPQVDFSVNANGTLNLLEATRSFSPDAVFIFMSTNKVYGDRPNFLPLIEGPTRWEIAPGHPYAITGIPEDMPIDNCLHSVFGASKVAADVLVQEYGRYFGLRTACFRGGCLTGPNHAGTQLHGFLAYLVRCNITGTRYSVFGYKGKQVRDNIHSGDLVRAFEAFSIAPRSGAVYNIGGGQYSNCSIMEAIRISEEITGRPLNWEYVDQNRKGDHIWYVSDLSKFQRDYPVWKPRYDIRGIIREIYEHNATRWASEYRQSCTYTPAARAG
jgi:CDP-paratose 2-epimerase